MGRDISLLPRQSNTREFLQIQVFDLESINNHFRENIVFIQNLDHVIGSLLAEGNDEEAKNIERFQIVFLDSALDFYLHELMKYGIVKIYHKEWVEKTEKYNNLLLSMGTVEKAISNLEDDTWLRNWITEQYAGQPFQSFSGLKLVCNTLGLNLETIAREAFYNRGSTEKPKDKLERRLNELYARRNAIAHQSDRIRENATIMDISTEEIQHFREDIEKIINAINTVVAFKEKTQH